MYDFPAPSLYEPWREINLVGIRSTPILKEIDLFGQLRLKDISR